MDAATLRAEASTLLDIAEREGRGLTPDEAARYDAIVASLQGRGRDSPPPGQPRQVEHKAAAAQSAVSAFSPGSPRKKDDKDMAVSRYSELIDQRAALVQENKDTIEAAHAGGRDLTPEEIRASDERNERIRWASRQIDILEAQREAERLVSGASGGSSTPAASSPRAGALDFARPSAAAQNWGYKYGVRLVTGADGKQTYGGVRNAFDIALGDFLHSVIEAQANPSAADPRLFRAGPSGGSTSVPSDGGFLVGSDFTMALLDMAVEQSQLAKFARIFDLGAGSDKLEAPYLQNTSRATGSRWGGVRVYRRAEADTVTASKPTLEKFELELEDLMGIAYVTNRVLRDAPALGQLYRDAFTSEFAFTLDDEIFRGTGVGQCLGIIHANNGALVSVSAEAGQGADTILAENIINMYGRMHPRSVQNAVWLVNQAAFPQLQTMQIGTGTSGQLVYMPAGGLSGQPYATLYGRPVIAIEQASALGDVGDIVFADLSQYILVRKGGIEEAESMHVRFLYDETAFRWIQRINGRPKDRSAITPYKGANTLSPFVALAAR